MKGTKVGNTITIPTNQVLDFFAGPDVTFTLNWVERTNNNGQISFKKSEESEITFTVLDNVITLDNSSPEHFIGVCYQYQGEEYFDGEGDWNTSWNLHEGYVPASTELITPPDGMTSETWYSDAVGPYGQLYTENVEVDFSGDEVYIKGIFSTFPDSWIKGNTSSTSMAYATTKLPMAQPPTPSTPQKSKEA